MTAAYRIESRHCPGCGRGVPYYVTAEAARPIFAHCETCHEDDHRACQNCGACLSRSGRGAFETARWRGSSAVRIDKRHCSGRCRTAAYRRRLREREEGAE